MGGGKRSFANYNWENVNCVSDYIKDYFLMNMIMTFHNVWNLLQNNPRKKAGVGRKHR